MKQKTLNIETKGRGTHAISHDIQKIVGEHFISSGLCQQKAKYIMLV